MGASSCGSGVSRERDPTEELAPMGSCDISKGHRGQGPLLQPRVAPLAYSRHYYIRNNARRFPMHTLKLTQIGNSVGVVLPKELLARLKLEKGDTVFLTESPDGYRITPHDPAFEAQMEAAREIMKSRRAVLRELAK